MIISLLFLFLLSVYINEAKTCFILTAIGITMHQWLNSEGLAVVYLFCIPLGELRISCMDNINTFYDDELIYFDAISEILVMKKEEKISGPSGQLLLILRFLLS